MLAAGVLLVLAPIQAQQDARGAYPPQMSGSTAEVYKTVGDTELKLYIYRPQGVAAGETRPAIIFFFGGGWRSGTPQQFAHQCLYLASRGTIAISADYRVSSRNGTKASLLTTRRSSITPTPASTVGRTGLPRNRHRSSKPLRVSRTFRPLRPNSNMSKLRNRIKPILLRRITGFPLMPR